MTIDQLPKNTRPISIGTRVKQTRCTPGFGFEKHLGRIATVVDTFIDENHVQHAKTDDGVWCQARHLDAVPRRST